MAEFQRLINLKADTTMIENQSRSKHSVHAVSEKKPYRLPQPSRFDNSKDQRQPKSDSNTVPRTPCWQCGKMHFVRDCNFTDHLCKVCKNVGHKEGYCKAMRSKSSNNNTYQKSEKNQNQNQKKSQGIFVNHVTKNTAKRKFISIIINGITTSLQLDTASDITVISKTTWQHLGQPKLSQASIEASNASGEQLKLIGEFECEVILNAITEKCVCFVTSSPVLNVIGIDWIDRFNLWAIPFDVLCKKVSSACPKDRIVQLQSKYPTVFDDSLGHCTKTKVKLFLKPNVKPVFCPKRPVPFNTIALVDAELSRLQSLGIITPIDFSEWAAPIVAIRKPNGKVRICADYSTGLNEALESNHYPLPTPEEIFAQLNGSVVFSIVDLSDAYLQVEVEDESKHLLTINTHRGLFQFNRLAPGVKSAPGAFQRLVDGMIADIPGVRTFLDDAIIFGKTWEAHKQSLDTFLQRLKEYGFHVKLEKCHFYQTEIVYLGHVVDRNGIRPDPEKLKTIASIPAPTNISELRSFLGAVNFYGRFVRNMHELRHPLDQLLKKDTKWKWNSDCQTSFEKFKKVLQSDLLLTHYDPNLPIIVAADASSTGVGAVIFHKFPNGYLKAIQHASRTLTSAEQGYGQPEKEALALTYGVTKFHKYLLGRKFTLLTDHKPLLSIFGSKKGIPLHTANRLQRWALMLLNYDFTIEYVSTTEFGCADMLSRLIDRCKQPEEDYCSRPLYEMNPEGSAPIAPKTTPHAPPAHIKAEHEERHAVSKISFPDFDVDDVDTWFLCLEAAFNVNDVKSDKQKFNTVIVSLGNRAKYVYTAIAKCNKSENNDRYITMENAVLEYFQPSENQRLTNLLSGVSLGDHKPSMLLSEMRRLGREGCSDSVLLNIWLRALPNTVRSIVSALPTATLDEQAIVADKIMEAPRTEIAPHSKNGSNNSPGDWTKFSRLIDAQLITHPGYNFRRRPV
ncbi:uncharacterized protein LOC133390958 [Anopheles gambiae]|uniref:uncharacterized protein LOC133390958 n=1 Tax=Anopheles gambiae TaxID=7165 RepID=UPI002AC96626|nr:uncharacterized protein LOC133390958 [Anopheles gambiae]